VSKHNRERRLMKAARGHPSLKPLHRRKVLRIVVTETHEERNGKWVHVNTNIDCGGLSESDAAMLAYRAGSGMMAALARTTEAKGVQRAETDTVDASGAPGESGCAGSVAAGQATEGRGGGGVRVGDPQGEVFIVKEVSGEQAALCEVWEDDPAGQAGGTA